MPEQLDRIERMLDEALKEAELYKEAWRAERAVKRTVARAAYFGIKERDALIHDGCRGVDHRTSTQDYRKRWDTSYYAPDTYVHDFWKKFFEKRRVKV